MNNRDLKRAVVYAVAVLMVMAGLSNSTRAQTALVFERIIVEYQTVEVRKADGSVFRAEFLSEIVLLSDGRASGGFGMWELNGPATLSLYRVVEGKSNGLFLTLKAKSLLPSTAADITINLRVPKGTPTGTVTFTIDGLPNGSLNFAAGGDVRQGCIGDRCTDTLPQFSLIRADPQSVLVQTFTGDYTADFEDVVLVFSEGRSIGSLKLSSPTGTVQDIRVRGGEVLSRDGASVAWLRGQAANAGDAQPLPVLIVIADQQDASEPCRIYDIAGTQVPAHFEAQGRITGLATDPF